MFKTKPKTPFKPSGHQVLIKLSLPPINGAMIAMEMGKMIKKTKTELRRPERMVERIESGEVMKRLIRVTDDSLSLLRVPGGMGK